MIYVCIYVWLLPYSLLPCIFMNVPAHLYDVFHQIWHHNHKDFEQIRSIGVRTIHFFTVPAPHKVILMTQEATHARLQQLWNETLSHLLYVCLHTLYILERREQRLDTGGLPFRNSFWSGRALSHAILHIFPQLQELLHSKSAPPCGGFLTFLTLQMFTRDTSLPNYWGNTSDHRVRTRAIFLWLYRLITSADGIFY
jgi:hypothetical protein